MTSSSPGVPATTEPAGIPWAHADNRLHPDAAHHCRCSCHTHIDPECSEHGWMYAGPDPVPAAASATTADDMTPQPHPVLGEGSTSFMVASYWKDRAEQADAALAARDEQIKADVLALPRMAVNDSSPAEWVRQSDVLRLIGGTS